MKIPCAERIPFVLSGLSFLQAELTDIQFQNITLIATALILGAKFNLTEISRMWLKEKCISTLSYFMSDAKFSTAEMQHLYILRVLHSYKIRKGCFLIDDTMEHHTRFCKWIYGVFYLFDHSIGTNLRAVCVVFLYYNDNDEIKFPIDFRIFCKEEVDMPWQRSRHFEHKTKYALAIEMIEKALASGFPKCTVLADSWFGIAPFIKELKRLNLSYVLEIRSSAKIRQYCKTPKLTPTGRPAKKQYDNIPLPQFFDSVPSHVICGFAADKEINKKEKILYRAKVATAGLNAVSGKHRIVQSIHDKKHTVKYLITNELTWEAAKILSSYHQRWAIEEFFKNAKQLTDMEGATVRSEQGVTLSLCLITWIDFLLHFENYSQRIVGKLTKDSLTIPSIVRQAQYDNAKAFFDKVQNDEEYVKKWLEVEKANIERSRKKQKKLIEIDQNNETKFDLAA